jgi:dCMP deaminase
MNKWNMRYFSLALEVATWSKDPEKQVGAICVSPDKRNLVIGFNGFPVGIKDSEDRLESKALKNKLMVHAEANCIVNGETSLRGWTMHVTKAPCSNCAKLMINARIKNVICPSPGGSWKEDQLLAISLLKEANIGVVFYGSELE